MFDYLNIQDIAATNSPPNLCKLCKDLMAPFTSPIFAG